MNNNLPINQLRVNLIDTIGLFYFFENPSERDNTYNYVEGSFKLQVNKFNPANIVSETHYRLYYVKNMRIMLYSNRVKVQGSIPRFYNGNNLEQLTDEQVVKAFENLQHSLPFVNWYKSRVARIDLGLNLYVSFASQLLLSKIIDKKYGVKTVYKSNGGTVDVGNASQQFSIYDKGAESEEAIANCVRLEDRSLKPKMVNKKFSSENLTLEELLSKLHLLPKIWYTEYQKIIKDYSPCFKSISSKTDFNHVLAYKYGYENCLNLIESSFDVNTISLTQKNNLRRYVRNIASDGKTIAHPSSPVLEVDGLVEEYMRLCNERYKLK